MLIKDDAVFHSLQQLPERFYRSIEGFINKLLGFQLDGLCNVILFGSSASGNVRTGSDVDICVVTNEQLTNRIIRQTIRELADGLECEFDIVFYHKDALDNNDTFTRNLKKGICLLKEA